MGFIDMDYDVEILDMDEDGERLWQSCHKDDKNPNVGYIDDLIVVIGSDEDTVREIAKNAMIAELELR